MEQNIKVETETTSLSRSRRRNDDAAPGNSAATRRPLDVEDYIDILRRHKAWILGPVFAALVVSVVVAFLWPDTYVSIATIRVVPPQVPENFVATNTSGDVQGRVNSLVQLILNRATLAQHHQHSRTL